MSATIENNGEDIPMENVHHLKEPLRGAKKVYRKFPPSARSRNEDTRRLLNEPESTVWDVYNNEARKVDTELVNDWKESLNSLLVFAAIFAVVLTAFIIESKKLLEPDQTEFLVKMAIFYLSHNGNIPNTPFFPPEFVLTSGAVSINCLLFASLGTSLFAALASVVALQWVIDYDAAIRRGGSSPEDRAKRRQYHYAGILNWKMGEIIAALPLFLYASVALFWAGAIQWMWAIHPTVGYVVAGGTAMAVLLYASTTLIAAIFVSAPFRTPLSRGIYRICKPWLSLLYKLLGTRYINFIPRLLLGIISYILAHLSQPLFKPFANSAFRSQLVNASKRVQENLLPHVTASQREDKAATLDESLGEQAMLWLANQLPISLDAHHRQLLLIGEVLNQSSKQSFADGFFKAPGWWFFDCVGLHYLQKVLNGPLSEDDQEQLSLLVKCTEVPEIRARLVSVGKYEDRLSSAVHRRQYGLDYAEDRLEPAIPNFAFPVVRSAAFSAVGKFAQNAQLRDGARAVLPLFINMLRDCDIDVRLDAIGALVKSAEQAELRDAIRDSIPSFVRLLEDPDFSVRSAAVGTLGKLAKHVELRGAIRDSIPSVFELLKRPDSYVRFAAVGTLGGLAKYAELRDAIRDSIPSFVKLLKDPDFNVRSAAVDTLDELTEQAEFRDAIRDSIPSIVELLKHPNPRVRSAATIALGNWAGHGLLAA